MTGAEGWDVFTFIRRWTKGHSRSISVKGRGVSLLECWRGKLWSTNDKEASWSRSSWSLSWHIWILLEWRGKGRSATVNKMKSTQSEYQSLANSRTRETNNHTQTHTYSGLTNIKHVNGLEKQKDPHRSIRLS